jgi:D-alanyl-D-alanine carboxypeptidase
VVSSGVIAVCAIAGGAYAYYEQYRAFAAALNDTGMARFEMKALQERAAAAEEENEKLRNLLQAAAQENETFGQQVKSLSEQVGYLDKLSKTDRELLQKYSSVYFLNDNFVPDPLSPLNSEMLYRTEGNLMIHGHVFPFLKKMMDAAAADTVPLKIISAYRSFGTQSVLKNNYTITYGAGTANTFSADQGYSEHQLGSTIDFTTMETGTDFESFEETQQYRWLLQHAYKYGFILSYPRGNNYFKFEPWHWRFVGVDLATRLYNENKNFYDLDQREINPYLARIFDGIEKI